jgi:hypothetical protein
LDQPVSIHPGLLAQEGGALTEEWVQLVRELRHDVAGEALDL